MRAHFLVSRWPSSLISSHGRGQREEASFLMSLLFSVFFFFLIFYFSIWGNALDIVSQHREEKDMEGGILKAGMEGEQLGSTWEMQTP